ncbi:uncharacterized protein LOC119037842 isoform X2 [Artibeus jamaicensis]|uniref:uncharacterized protein LOC119037842 isoform X2 n=1 Tax=Artibeus jamaicensis TaxID=9417 RepID=UPI00235AEA2F|nr:uncharacterized protein LOC119037842 isoform X2 [Artibeus jamaicensis]
MWCVARGDSAGPGQEPSGATRPLRLASAPPSRTAPSLEAPPVVLPGSCTHAAFHELTLHATRTFVPSGPGVRWARVRVPLRGGVRSWQPRPSAPAGPSRSGRGRRVPGTALPACSVHIPAPPLSPECRNRPPLGFQVVFPEGPRLASSLRPPARQGPHPELGCRLYLHLPRQQQEEVERLLGGSEEPDKGWQDLAGRLGYQAEAVETMARSRVPASALLRDWAVQEGSGATLRVLEDALAAMGREDVVQVLGLPPEGYCVV